jgi:hypothetical protein
MLIQKIQKIQLHTTALRIMTWGAVKILEVGQLPPLAAESKQEAELGTRYPTIRDY